MSSRKTMTPRLPSPGPGKIGRRQDSCVAVTPKAPTKFTDTKASKRNPNIDADQFAPTEAKMISNHHRMAGYG